MKHITDKQMREVYESLDRCNKEVDDYNNKILSELGDTAQKDFVELLEGSAVTGKIEIVKKPYGEAQDETCGMFENIHVDQHSVGMEGDSYAGYIYGQISKNKWLKVPYEC